MGRVGACVFDLGLGEMLVIAVLVIVFVGPDGLPDLMRVLGRFYGQMRRASDDLRRTFNAEVARVDSDRRREELHQRRLERERARAASSEVDPAGPAAPADPHAHGDPELESAPPLLPPDPRLPPSLPSDRAARVLPGAPPGAVPRPTAPPRPTLTPARPPLAFPDATLVPEGAPEATNRGTSTPDPTDP